LWGRGFPEYWVGYVGTTNINKPGVFRGVSWFDKRACDFWGWGSQIILNKNDEENRYRRLQRGVISQGTLLWGQSAEFKGRKRDGGAGLISSGKWRDGR